MSDFISGLFILGLTVLFGMWWVLRPNRVSAVHTTKHDLPVMLIKDDILHYASDDALARFPVAIGAHNWNDLYEILCPQFPDFPRLLLSESHPITTVYSANATQAHDSAVHIEWRKNGAALTFIDTERIIAAESEVGELQVLREMSANLPYAVWKTDGTGTVVWQNDVYSALASTIPEARRNTPEPIFDLPSPPDVQDTVRVKLAGSDQQEAEWFNVTRVSLSQGAMHYASSLTALIKAEDAQKDFVQTLAKTFAHLSIGLAIFNRDRQLALFNPALIDLTGLSASFLSPRPTIDSFFDAMRENRRMPEPKNYTTWRHRMADLVSAAEVGRFVETWTLESGQTYSIKGRPHPNGAIAFLFEDISAEVSLTRNFRAELELGQSLVDTFEDALAVFSRSGILTFSNKSYDLLWGFENQSSFADVTISDAVHLWKEKSLANPMWQDIQDAVMTLGAREAWDMPVCIKGQKPMQCRIVPIASGATAIRFSHNSVSAPAFLPDLKKSHD